MTFSMLDALRDAIRSGHSDLIEHVKPRDETERAICDALGECSWDECVTAIQKYRSEQLPTTGGE